MVKQYWERSIVVDMTASDCCPLTKQTFTYRRMQRCGGALSIKELKPLITNFAKEHK